MTPTAQRSVLPCGCVVVQRTADNVVPLHSSPSRELLFLTPCSEEHRELAFRVRGSHKGRSSLVVKAVPK